MKATDSPYETDIEVRGSRDSDIYGTCFTLIFIVLLLNNIIPSLQKKGITTDLIFLLVFLGVMLTLLILYIVSYYSPGSMFFNNRIGYIARFSVM